MLGDENRIKVLDLVNKDTDSVELQTPIIETILLMQKTNKPYVPVIDNGQCVGLISYLDVIGKFIRI